MFRTLVEFDPSYHSRKRYYFSIIAVLWLLMLSITAIVHIWLAQPTIEDNYQIEWVKVAPLKAPIPRKQYPQHCDSSELNTTAPAIPTSTKTPKSSELITESIANYGCSNVELPILPAIDGGRDGGSCGCTIGGIVGGTT